MEAALASQYHGTDGDLRSLYRRGSGMTLRRLWVLIQGLRYDSPFWAALEKAEQQSTVDKLRARQAHYEGR